MDYPRTVDVLIVGAGPSGLTMAHELARRGIKNIRIIDKLSQSCKESRALAIHARTLEIFERMGIIRDFLTIGNKIHEINFSKDLVNPLVHISSESIKSHYPFILVLPQHKTEAIFTDKLKKLGITVERNIELIDFKQEHVIRATLKNKKGTIETIQAKYLIGCDGAHSICRSIAGINFAGKSYDSQWLLADAYVKGDISFSEANIALTNMGILAVLPIKKNYVRFITNYQSTLNDEDLSKKLTTKFLQQLINERVATKIKIEKLGWTSAFRISHHIAETMFSRNVFLVGDSAHIHSPAGGQGMNTGIQDAYSLAWKLALVLDNKSHKTLLESQSERDHIIKKIVSISHSLTMMASIKNPLLLYLRNTILKQLNNSESWKSNFINRIAQVTQNYRHSAIVHEDWPDQKVRLQAGDFCPQIILTNGKHSNNLRTIVGDIKHCLLLFGSNDQTHEISKKIAQRFSEIIAVIKVGNDTEYKVSEETMINLGITDTGIYLIRPDGYIGYRSAPATLKDLERYLHKVFI